MSHGMIDLDGAHRLTQFNPLITSREMDVQEDRDLEGQGPKNRSPNSKSYVYPTKCSSYLQNTEENKGKGSQARYYTHSTQEPWELFVLKKRNTVLGWAVTKKIAPSFLKHLSIYMQPLWEELRCQGKSDRRNRYWPCPDGVFRLEYTLCRWLCNCFFIYWGPAEMPQELLWDYRETQVWLILPLPDLLIVSSCFYTGTSCKTSFEDKTC